LELILRHVLVGEQKTGDSLDGHHVVMGVVLPILSDDGEEFLDDFLRDVCAFIDNILENFETTSQSIFIPKRWVL
jgi:hypothetical protein